MHYQNDVMMIWASRVYPGILDLFYRDDETGKWTQFNNVVAVSQAANAPSDQWGNAEINETPIHPRLLGAGPNGLEIEFQYDAFPDGVHFRAIARLDPAKVEASFRVILNEDSAPISRFTFAEFFGLAEHCRYIEVNGKLYDSTRDFPTPSNGYFMPGTFSSVPLPADGVVRFWGPNKLVQYQRAMSPWLPGDEIDIEVRKSVWRPEQDTPGNPYRSPGFVWLELVQMMRTGNFEALEWRMGLEPVRQGSPPPAWPAGHRL